MKYIFLQTTFTTEFFERMKRTIELCLTKQYWLLIIPHRFVSNKSYIKCEGVRERIDENQTRLYFDQWLKARW